VAADAVLRELASVRSAQKNLLSRGTRPVLQASVLLLCLLINGVFLLFRPDYVVLFVAASFYLNMGYFITLLVPTSPGSAQVSLPEIRKFQAWLLENGIRTGTTRFTRVFVNAFFMNSRALSLGISLLFALDILLVLLAYLGGLPAQTTLLVALQCAIIIVFYLLVWKTEPFTSRFGENLDSVKDRLGRDLPPWLISFLFLVGFLLIVLVFLTTIILMPGMTLDAFVTQSGLTELAHRFIPIGILVASQYFLIRYIHGVTSRVMAGRLLDHREQLLQALRQQAPKVPAEGPDGGGGPDQAFFASEALIESRIYTVKRNTLLGMFPVYVIDLDFSVLLDSTTQMVIRGYIRKP
jgi:hypothetical protein